MPDFPIDVVVDILLRLPVISLLRFRCVSKLFCALIDSHDFIGSHLKRSIETQNHRSLVLETKRQNPFCYLNFDSLDTAVELDYPLKPTGLWSTEIFGSCHGLVGLCNGRDLAIWNPSTRRCKKLPYAKYTGHADGLLEMYGFGYDSVNDDYKVVKSVRFIQASPQDDRKFSFGYLVKVYSMKSNSWKMIPDYPHFILPARSCGMLVGSALHWVVLRDLSHRDKFITAIDLAAEDYRLVPQPEFSDNTFDMNIAELGGCLCLLCNYKQVRVDVWVMKDYGVKESWSKLFSVAQPEVIQSFNQFVIPLAYSKSGSEVLFVQDNQQLGWYDLEQENIKKIETRGIPDDFESFLFVESLIPLDGGSASLDEEGETYAIVSGQ